MIAPSSLAALLEQRGRTGRHVTAIAGPPGAGKSTLAETLAGQLNAAAPGSAAILPMDGYHFDDMLLKARGWLARKGAPHTFDVGGYAHMLNRLRANAEPEIAVPVFDREIEIARAGARSIPQTVRHLLTEGNYLLLDEAPWSDLAPLLDTTIYLDVPMQILARRLAARWQHLEPEARARKLDGNDLPNARKVQACRRPADIVLRDTQA